MPKKRKRSRMRNQRGRLATNLKFQKKSVFAITILLALIGTVVLLKIFAATQTTDFTAVADSYISKDNPKRNFGTAASLQSSASSASSGRRDIVVQFDTQSLPEGKITGATLSLYATNGSKSGGSVFAMDSGWKETSVNWANKPAVLGNSLGNIGPVAAGKWYKVDVTPSVAGSGSISFRVTGSSSDTATFASKELDPTLAPKLSVSVEPIIAITTVESGTTPEGAKIEINSQGNFTYDSVYKMLKANAYSVDFAKIAPLLTIKVQDTYASQASAVTSTSNGTCANFRAYIYLKGVDSSFSLKPQSVLAHEYGHVWSQYHRCFSHNNNWAAYLNTRWSSTDGSVRLNSDSKLDSSYAWDTNEIFAEDYRLLFGTGDALFGSHLNREIPDPRNQPGLKEFLIGTWAN